MTQLSPDGRGFSLMTCTSRSVFYQNQHDDDDGYDGDDDIYIMVRCMSVTFLLIFVSRNGRKRVLPFLDTFGSRNKRKCA